MEHYTAGLQFNKTGTDQNIKICCYLYYVVNQLNPNLYVKLETSCTVILCRLRWVSVIWVNTLK